jgi:hypothetical protein
LLLKYIALFLAIQLVSLILVILGVPLCAALAYLHGGDFDGTHYHWPRWAWLWDNEEDGVAPAWYRQAHADWSLERIMFVWAGLRNPANNLRFVPGVSGKGRPLWRKTWGPRPGGWYAQAGWLGTGGWPVLSAGRNVNDW